MTKNEKDDIEEQDIVDEMEKEIEEIEDDEGEVDEKKLNEAVNSNPSVEKLKETLAIISADFENFKKRTDRDRSDMIFFLKSDIFKKILPRIDDLERIIKNTPEDLQVWPLFEWICVLEKNFKKDIISLWVDYFESIWNEVDPDKHDVMTQIPWKEWIIIDEFEKWYMLSGRVFRHAKVVVWNGEI